MPALFLLSRNLSGRSNFPQKVLKNRRFLNLRKEYFLSLLTKCHKIFIISTSENFSFADKTRLSLKDVYENRRNSQEQKTICFI